MILFSGHFLVLFLQSLLVAKEVISVRIKEIKLVSLPFLSATYEKRHKLGVSELPYLLYVSFLNYRISVLTRRLPLSLLALTFRICICMVDLAVKRV